MIVVSDTSCINNLAAINQIHLLHQLYGTDKVKPLLNALVNEAGFWVAESLHDSVLRAVGETD